MSLTSPIYEVEYMKALGWNTLTMAHPPTKLATAGGQMLGRRIHQAATLFCVKWRHGRHLEINYDIKRKIRPRQWRRIYVKNIPVKFHHDMIWNDGASGFFEDDRPNKNIASSDALRSVPDLLTPFCDIHCSTFVLVLLVGATQDYKKSTCLSFRQIHAQPS